MTNDLTVADATALAEHEAVIERGLNTFVEVGSALLAIREGRLYRADHATFDAYCQERWGMGRDYADRVIAAASVVPTIVSKGLPAPGNEAQARELAKVPEEQRADVWRETVERTNGKPTAAAVRETFAPPPRAEPVRPPITDEQVAELRSVETAPHRPLERDVPAAEPDEAELFASLDEATEGTDARFQLNFGRAMKNLFTVLSFDPERVVETSDHATLLGELALLTQWIEDLRRRMKPGLRVVGGDK